MAGTLAPVESQVDGELAAVVGQMVEDSVADSDRSVAGRS